MILYVKYGKDELPEGIGESYRELSEMTGVPISSIAAGLSRGSPQYARVEIDDDDDDD